MEISEIRLKNLIELLAVHSSTGRKDKDFAVICGISIQQFSHIKTGRRAIGSSIARRMEQNLNLPKGYFDTARGANEARDQLRNFDQKAGRKCVVILDNGMSPMILPKDEVWYLSGEEPAPSKLGVINAGGRVIVREYRENWVNDGMVGIWCAVNNRYTDIPAEKVELLGRATLIVRDTN